MLSGANRNALVKTAYKSVQQFLRLACINSKTQYITVFLINLLKTVAISLYVLINRTQNTSESMYLKNMHQKQTTFILLTNIGGYVIIATVNSNSKYVPTLL